MSYVNIKKRDNKDEQSSWPSINGTLMLQSYTEGNTKKRNRGPSERRVSRQEIQLMSKLHAKK